MLAAASAILAEGTSCSLDYIFPGIVDVNKRLFIYLLAIYVTLEDYLFKPFLILLFFICFAFEL